MVVIYHHAYLKCAQSFKGPFCNPNMLFLWHSSGDIYRQNKVFSKFSFDSEVAFASYAHFTVSYCYLGHYVGNYYVDIIDNLNDYLTKQMNLQEIWCTQTLCT